MILDQQRVRASFYWQPVCYSKIAETMVICVLGNAALIYLWTRVRLESLFKKEQDSYKFANFS